MTGGLFALPEKVMYLSLLVLTAVEESDIFVLIRDKYITFGGRNYEKD